MKADSVHTLAIYSLITDKQIQVGQPANRHSHTLKLPAVVNSSSKALLLSLEYKKQKYSGALALYKSI